MILHLLSVWEWMGYAAWAAVHAYIPNSWFNEYEEIYFLESGHQSHAPKTPNATAQKVSLYNTCHVESDKRSHHHPPHGKGVDAVLY